jgi:3D (Asp-Asp-Asp) domain-containing protein
MKYNWNNLGNLYRSIILGAALAVSPAADAKTQQPVHNKIPSTATAHSNIKHGKEKKEKRKQAVQSDGTRAEKDDASQERIMQYLEHRKRYQALPSRGGYVHLTPANVSAYTLLECGKMNGITASGESVRKGRTVAASRNLRFGTELYIPVFDPQNPEFKKLPEELQNYLRESGYNGFFEVNDRGSAVKGNRIDVYFGQTRRARHYALNFGRRNLRIYIIN